MKRDWLYIGLIIVVIFFIFAVYIYVKDINYNINDSFESFNSLKGNSKDEGSFTGNNNQENQMPNSNTNNNAPVSGGGGGSGSSRNQGSGGEFGSNVTSEDLQDRLNQSSCSLIRPGNLPDINCFVNYIKKESVSLKIENKLGEDIGIMMNLNSCSPELQDTIKNNEQKDFIFSCNNNDYFSQDILISYFLSGNGTVNIRGFVNGYVSS